MYHLWEWMGGVEGRLYLVEVWAADLHLDSTDFQHSALESLFFYVQILKYGPPYPLVKVREGQLTVNTHVIFRTW